MGFRIVSKKSLTPKVHRYEVDAPDIARKARPGQFIILRVDETGERIPLTVSGWDREKGTVSIVFNVVGKSTQKLAALNEGDEILNFAGPLGEPIKVEEFGTVLVIAHGYWSIACVPLIKELKEKGNRVISVMRAPTKEGMFGHQEMEAASDEFRLIVGDGTFGMEGFVLEPLKELLDGGERIDRALALGGICMMKACAYITKGYGIPTFASLNPIMVDGTGMCGCCRVKIGNNAKFACVDGPEFDAHQVDWDLLTSRRCTYFEDPDQTLQYRCMRCAQW